MTAIVVIPGGPFPAGSTVIYTGQITDGSGAGIPGSDLDTLTLTLSNTGSGAVVNDVSRANILNTGRGTVDEQGNLAVTLNPLDTLMIGAPVGTLAQRSLVLDWTFNSGGYTGRHEARLTFIALTEANLP